MSAVTPRPNAATFGMVEVTREQFFAVVGPLNVHPSVAHACFDPTWGYRADWTMLTGAGEVIGHSWNGPGYANGELAVYMLVPRLAEGKR